MKHIKIILGIIFLFCLMTTTYLTIAQDSLSNEAAEYVYKLKGDKFTKFEKKLEKEIEKNLAKKQEKEKDVADINMKFLWNLLIDIAAMLLIILFIYYPKNRQMESIFTFIMFNLIIFMLTFVLNKVKISMGAAFGLFAVFSMLRYRTEGISIKDMTYLFIFIALGLISAIQLEYYELGIINGVIVVFTFILDGNYIFTEHSKHIKYENIELIKPENRELLLQDLQKRTGFKVHNFIIEEINFLNDTADIKIFYRD